MQSEARGAIRCAGALALGALVCAGAPTPQRRACTGEVMLYLLGKQLELSSCLLSSTDKTD